ncbi:hypothetical protein PMAYCL1PPCAC_07517, partial [Pristionchus mayeri]
FYHNLWSQVKMPKRRRISKDEEIIRAEMEAEEAEERAEVQRIKLYKGRNLVVQLRQQKQSAQKKVVSLTGQVARLRRECAASAAASKQSATVAAAATIELIDIQSIMKHLTEENANLIDEVNVLIDQLRMDNWNEKQLMHERDELRRAFMIKADRKEILEKIQSNELTKNLAEKLASYSNRFITEQKVMEEEREKHKESQTELSNRIASLENRLTQKENDKQSVMEILKAADSVCENLKKDNNSLTEEFKTSLEAREKLNRNIDELEVSLKEQLRKSDKYEHTMESAEERIREMKSEKEEMKKVIATMGQEKKSSCTSPCPPFGPFSHPGASSPSDTTQL